MSNYDQTTNLLSQLKNKNHVEGGGSIPLLHIRDNDWNIYVVTAGPAVTMPRLATCRIQCVWFYPWMT